jgi:hypothetical protein
MDSNSPVEKKTSKTEKKSEEVKPIKRGKTAYTMFCSDERVKVKSEYPDMKPQEVMLELAARWQKLKDENITEFERYKNLVKPKNEDNE